MTSVRGYYDGNSVVFTDNVALKPNQQVIVTLLDEEYTMQRRKFTRQELDELVGSGINACPKEIDAQDFVKSMRSDDRVF
ncbi:MAG: hypothetical protein IJ717_06490 [Treponema sp.]|nr:hypothetical protein [Treponema sp.]